MCAITVDVRCVCVVCACVFSLLACSVIVITPNRIENDDVILWWRARAWVVALMELNFFCWLCQQVLHSFHHLFQVQKHTKQHTNIHTSSDSSIQYVPFIWDA